VRKKLGECLIQAGLITEQDLQIALAEHRRTGERVGAILVRLNFATEKQITKALAYQLGFPYVSLSDDPPERSAIVLIPKDIARARACVAVKLEKDLLTVATSDPLLFSLIQDLELQTGYRIRPVVATRSDILEAIESGYPVRPAKSHTGISTNIAVTVQAPAAVAESADAVSGTLTVLSDNHRSEQTANGPGSGHSDAAPIVDLVDLVVRSAIASRASDVHIEPAENGVLVRHRLDGLLHEVMDLPKWSHDGLVHRMKMMSGLDIAERHVPQEGRLRFKTGDDTDVDFRVSTLRTFFGEKIVLRVLNHRQGPLPLEELGLSAAAMEALRHFIRHQRGLILVVGPTGSGKTTTLGSVLNTLKSGRINITTIEDQIEYLIPGVNQSQVNEEAKLTFASALRAILHQDPDVVLVEEIRDKDTARIVMQAAQTGHLVLSTLPTNNAPATVTRLVDMGIEPYVIGSALVGIVAQRLVRRLCVACRRQCTPEAEMVRALSIPETSAEQFVFYKAVGCEECAHTGYRGRIALYEVMPVTDKMRRLIAQKAEEDLIREAAVEAGMTSLGEDGLVKVKAGITTAEELLRVLTDVRETRTLCPGCGGVVAMDFRSCPHCGHRLSHECPKCSRAVQPDWLVCPYCSSNAVSKKKKKLKEQKALEVPPSNVAEFKNQNR
jgi:type IV pilus assembly protein PilB